MSPANSAFASSPRHRSRARTPWPRQSWVPYRWRKGTVRDLIAARSIDLPGAERPRRLRANVALRALLRETRLAPAALVAPLFVVAGRGRQSEITSLVGHSRLSPDLAVKEAHRLANLG